MYLKDDIVYCNISVIMVKFYCQQTEEQELPGGGGIAIEAVASSSI